MSYLERKKQYPFTRLHAEHLPIAAAKVHSVGNNNHEDDNNEKIHTQKPIEEALIPLISHAQTTTSLEPMPAANAIVLNSTSLYCYTILQLMPIELNQNGATTQSYN